MSITERQRHELYLGFEEIMGQERADILMSLLPPVGWADVATKQDLAQLEASIEAKLERALREQLRTLVFALVGALATMTTLNLGAVALLT